jgi:acetyltransferase-like isoleucine patch superfamily enzyme
MSQSESIQMERERAAVRARRDSFEDPLSWIPRIATKLHSLWLTWTYPFVSVGGKFSIHHSCELRRSIASHIKIGSSVLLTRDVWLNIPVIPDHEEPVIILDDNVQIGRRCQISGKNRIHFERNAILASDVLVMDHNHAYEDVNIPILDQETTPGGTIRIEEECWIGLGAVIVCSQGELVIGKHSIVAANSMVTHSIPPYSVVAGNPARVVRYYDPIAQTWTMGSRSPAGRPQGN